MSATFKPWYCGWLRNPEIAPPKEPRYDSRVNTHKQRLLVLKWCEMDFATIHSAKGVAFVGKSKWEWARLTCQPPMLISQTAQFSAPFPFSHFLTSWTLDFLGRPVQRQTSKLALFLGPSSGEVSLVWWVPCLKDGPVSWTMLGMEALRRALVFQGQWAAVRRSEDVVLADPQRFGFCRSTAQKLG